MNDKEKQFIIGLEKLTRETGIAIGGCGCCGSPYLYKVETITRNESGYSITEGDNVTWIDPADEVGWNLYKDKIVKED